MQAVDRAFVGMTAAGRTTHSNFNRGSIEKACPGKPGHAVYPKH
jgi:hypothetical protein